MNSKRKFESARLELLKEANGSYVIVHNALAEAARQKGSSQLDMNEVKSIIRLMLDDPARDNATAKSSPRVAAM